MHECFVISVWSEKEEGGRVTEAGFLEIEQLDVLFRLRKARRKKPVHVLGACMHLQYSLMPCRIRR